MSELDYESTSEDNTSCEENIKKTKLVKKSSSQYKKNITINNNNNNNNTNTNRIISKNTILLIKGNRR